MTVGKQTAQLGNETANRIGDILTRLVMLGYHASIWSRRHLCILSRCVPSVCWMIDTFLGWLQ